MLKMVGTTAAATLAITAAFAASAPAKTFKVTRTSDPAPNGCKKKNCSLREAVQAANERAGKDTIVLPNRKKTYELTRPNTGGGEDGALEGDLDIANNPVRIVHPGKGRATIDANGLDRVFEIFAGAHTTMSKLVLTGGANAHSEDGDGGALMVDGAKLTIKRSILRGNTASGPDGSGGAIDVDGTAKFARIVRSKLIGNHSGDTGGAINGTDNTPLLISHSTLRANTADDDGGALDNGAMKVTRSRLIGNESGERGGAIDFGGGTVLVVKRSTIAGNAAANVGGGLHIDADARIAGTTISGNAATSANGGDGRGGGIYSSSSMTKIVNSTIADNTAVDEGGGFFAESGSEADLNAVTIAYNHADTDLSLGILAGGGIWVDSSDPVAIRNSLVVLNRAGVAENDCNGNPIQSLGGNLVSTINSGDCQGFDHPSDRVRANPKVGKLKRNGGPTATIGLRKGSPAIGKARKQSAPKRDQRGVKRDKRPDIGAFER